VLPYLTGQRPWFAFLVHPRDTEDLLRTGAGRFLRSFSGTDSELGEKMCSMPPLIIGHIRFGFAPYCGELIAAMCLPANIMTPEGQRAISLAAELAVKRGARVIGLGGLTGPATGGGQTLLKQLPAGVVVTNGNAYTAAVVCRNVVDAMHALELSRPCRVAVVGCTGSVGVAASQLIAQTGCDLVLISRNAARARGLVPSLVSTARFSDSMSSVLGADIVVLLTNDATARLDPEWLAGGTIVIDVAEPSNISMQARPVFRSRAICVVDGGVVRIPSLTCSYDVNGPRPPETFACLAETYMFGREGIQEHSVGRPDAERAMRMARLAEKYTVEPRPFAPACQPPQERPSPGHTCSQNDAQSEAEPACASTTTMAL